MYAFMHLLRPTNFVVQVKQPARCVCVRGCMCACTETIAFDLNIWHAGSSDPSRSFEKFKVMR